MAVYQAQVSVTTTPTVLNAAPSGGGMSINIQNPAAGQNVFIGTSAVTSSVYGYLLAPGASISVDSSAVGEALYGIVAATTQTVNVLGVTNTMVQGR